MFMLLNLTLWVQKSKGWFFAQKAQVLSITKPATPAASAKPAAFVDAAVGPEASRQLFLHLLLDIALKSCRLCNPHASARKPRHDG